MASRSDKRDALAISAYLTGLDVEFIDGVNGSLIHERAYPKVRYETSINSIWLKSETEMEIRGTTRNIGVLAWPYGDISDVSPKRSYYKFTY